MSTVKPRAAQEVKVEHRPAMTVAHVQHIGPYAGDGVLFRRLFGELGQWAGPRGLLGPTTRWLTISPDDPARTPPEQLRILAGVTVPPGTRPDGDIGVMELPAASTVVARFELGPDEYAGAWGWLFGTWLPGSGYQPDGAVPYEVYLGEPGPRGTHLVELCVPVKPR